MNQLLKLKWEQVPKFRKVLETTKIVHPVADVYWSTETKRKRGKKIFRALLQNLLKTIPNSKAQTQTHIMSLAESFKIIAPEGNINPGTTQIKKCKLSGTENNLIDRGLIFVPTSIVNKTLITNAVNQLARRLAIYSKI